MTDVVDNDNTPIDDSMFEPSTSEVSKLPESVNLDVKDVPAQEDQKGYKTYDQWVKEGRDPDEFKGRKAYEKEGERFKALITLQQEQKKQSEAMAKMWEYNKRIEVEARKTALEELKSQTLAATAVGDVTRVAELTDKLSKLHETAVPNYEPVAQPVPVNADAVFAQQNPWFDNPQSDTDYAKIGFTKSMDAQMVRDGLNKQMDMGQYLAELTRRVANKFNSPSVRNTTTVLPAISDATGNVSEGRKLIDSLPLVHKNIVASLKAGYKAKGKEFTLADVKRYVAQVKQLGEI